MPHQYVGSGRGMSGYVPARWNGSQLAWSRAGSPVAGSITIVSDGTRT